MKPARSEKPLKYPVSWKEFDHGNWAKSQIQMRLDEWLPKLFGYHLLKLGGLSCELSTQHTNIQHQVGVDLSSNKYDVCAEYFELPFINKAFDSCLLINQLDFCQDPHRLLREIDRVIIDDGYLIISGVNPSSLVGIGQFIPRRKQRFPWNGRMFSPLRVIDWLGLLNYQVLDYSCFGLIPVTKERAYVAWLEHLFSDFAPAIGSLYFIVARKRTFPLNPIKRRWQLKKQLSPLSVNYRIGD